MWTGSGNDHDPGDGPHGKEAKRGTAEDGSFGSTLYRIREVGKGRGGTGLVKTTTGRDRGRRRRVDSAT